MWQIFNLFIELNTWRILILALQIILVFSSVTWFMLVSFLRMQMRSQNQLPKHLLWKVWPRQCRKLFIIASMTYHYCLTLEGHIRWFWNLAAFWITLSIAFLSTIVDYCSSLLYIKCLYLFQLSGSVWRKMLMKWER